MMNYITPDESHYYIKLKPHQTRKADAFTLIDEGDGWERVIYYFLNALYNIVTTEYKAITAKTVSVSISGQIRLSTIKTSTALRIFQINPAIRYNIVFINLVYIRVYRVHKL